MSKKHRFELCFLDQISGVRCAIDSHVKREAKSAIQHFFGQHVKVKYTFEPDVTDQLSSDGGCKQVVCTVVVFHKPLTITVDVHYWTREDGTIRLQPVIQPNKELYRVSHAVANGSAPATV